MNGTANSEPFSQLRRNIVGDTIATVVQTTVAIVTIISNILVIIVSRKFRKPGDTGVKFIINLAVIDLLGGIALGQAMVVSSFPNVDRNEYFCFYKIQSLTFSSAASQFMVTATTVDRYLIICYRSIHGKLHKKQFGRITIAISWGLAFLLLLLPIMGMYRFDAKKLCVYRSHFANSIYLVSGIILFSCMVADFGMYITILLKARQYKRKVAVSSESNSEEQGKMKNKIRSAKITALVTVAFIVCWVPYYTLMFRFGLGVRNDSLIFARVAFILGMCKGSMNPFIYAWQKRDFRDKCLNLVKCE